jgi:hypothetical protein
MRDTPELVYTARPDATPKDEVDALAAIYSLCLQKHRESQKVVRPAPESDSPHTNEKFATEKRSQCDLSENAILDTEGDRTEQTRKDKHGFVHR